MFWASIMGRELIGPFWVCEGVKMTSEKYVEFLTDHFCTKRRTMLSMTKSSSAMHHVMLLGIPLPHWLFHTIENLWGILKQKIYEGGRQFTSKQQLWDALLTSCKDIQAEALQKLMDGYKNCEAVIK